MSISTGIPSNWALPLLWAVVDGSQAGNLTESQPALLVGQAFLGGDAAVAPKGGMSGNGLLTLDPLYPVTANATLGTYKVVFTSATAFSVTPPINGMTQGAGQVGTPYMGAIKFNIAAGSAPFAVGDEFDVAVGGLPTGNAAYNVPVPVGSLALAKLMFGEGSMLERMVAAFLQGNTTQQLWAIPVPRPVAGIKATGSIGIATAPTSSGILTLYIAGQKVQVTVYSTDTQASIATNLAAAINGLTTLPVTAVVDGTVVGKVNLTCRWHGLTGNDVTIIPNYGGVYDGEMLPAGLMLAIGAMAGGNGNPDFTAAISAIQSKQFYHVAMPYSDTGSLQVWDAEMGFGPTGRWNFTRQQYGWVYNYRRDTYAGLLVWGLTVNSPVISTMGLEPMAPSPVWEFAAGYCAQGSAALLDDPARPLQSLEIPRCLPATADQRFSQSQLNSLTNSGLAIQGVAPSGNPMILREATQYQRNQYGQADTAFALLTVLSNLAELLSRMKSAITSKYPRHKLGQDDVNYGPGQKIMTPSLAKAELVAEASAAIRDGLMQNLSAFKKNLLVEIDDNNPNRLNVLWPPQLMGQLRQFDVLAQFRLLADNFQG